jgi:hypothetical protein
MRRIALLLALLPAPALAAGVDESADAGAEAPAAAQPEFAFFGAPAAPGPQARREVVGLIVNGRELAEGIALLVAPDGTRLLPLRELAPLLALEVVETREGLRLDTPLGTALFPWAVLSRRADEFYVALPEAAARLAAEVDFDAADYALRIRLVWEPRPRPGVTPEAPIRPDTRAPTASLSRLRGEALAERARGEWREQAFLEGFGRLGPGAWQARVARDAAGEVYAQDWHWRTRRDGFAALLGQQFVGVHPLLSGFALTGAQLAWSDRPDRLLVADAQGRLVQDRAAPVRDLRGEGPPGGVAELIIDGVVRARARIPLDGRFEFLDVPVPPGFARVEVALYTPFALATPAEVLDFSARASDRLLPAGATLLFAGLGREGNPLDDRLPEGDTAGFLLARRSLGEGLTVEAAGQRSAAGEQAALGAVLRAGPLGVLAGSLARGDGASAHLLTLDGDRGPAFWRASLREQQAGFRAGQDLDLSDRYAEIGWRHWPRWEVSLVARERRGFGTEVDFVKPAARLRPLPGLWLQSRPDFDGFYVHEANWQIDRATRASARQSRTSRDLALERRFSPQWLGFASYTELRDGRGRRGSLGAAWQSLDPFGWYAEAAWLGGSGGSGFSLRSGRELRPGIRFRLEARRDPLDDFDGPGTSLLAALSWDLGRAGGGFTRAAGGRAGVGAVGGVLHAPAGLAALPSVPVRVDGQVRGRSDGAGRFHLADLVPGVYRIELDEEHLPLELSPEDTGFWVEVAEGATTRVEFRVGLRLGAAGRLLHADGTPAEGGEVRVLDGEGRVRARATASAFGYYRVDGLPPGSYSLVWLDEAGRIRAGRRLDLSDTFVFAQDLREGADSGVSSETDRSAEDDDAQD